jgi:hypothetical protein
MADSLSKATMTLLHSMEAIIEAVKLYGARASSELGARYPEQPLFGGDAIGHVLNAQRWLLEQMSLALIDAEEGLLEELSDNKAIRARLLDAVALVRSELVHARELVRSMYAPPVVAKIGVNEPIPDDPATLMRYATGVLAQLKVHSGVPGMLGVTINLAPLVEGVEEHLRDLERAHDAARQDVRQDIEARTRRDAALAAAREAYCSAGAIVEGIFFQAGMSELATRIHPTELRAEGAEEAPDVT